MIVTSGRFTQDAVNEAKKLPQVTLVCGDDLAELMLGNGIGVRDEIMTLPHADLAALESELRSPI